MPGDVTPIHAARAYLRTLVAECKPPVAERNAALDWAASVMADPDASERSKQVAAKIIQADLRTMGQIAADLDRAERGADVTPATIVIHAPSEKEPEPIQ